MMRAPSSGPLQPVASRRPQRVAVLLLPDVHVLDYAGPVQVLDDSILGGAYHLSYCAQTPEIVSAQGMVLAGLVALPDPAEEDLILVPGVSTTALDRLDRTVPVEWLREAHRKGTRIAAICTGAFALAKAGLLDGRKCTTHWDVVDRLRAEFPRVEVIDNRLFIEDGNLMTSAGGASSIDMALALVEQDHGPLLAARVAREMVVYLRRSGDQDQRSVYLDHRNHLDPGIHRAQDFILEHPDRHLLTEELAHLAAMSPRNFTRVFRRATGISPKQFASRVQLQVAEDLLDDPQRTIESIASSCGFRNARALRRVWQNVFGVSISDFRESRKSLRASAGQSDRASAALLLR